MQRHPPDRTGRPRQERWEFIWWGVGRRAREKRALDSELPILRSWRLGPFEIRICEVVPPHSPQNRPDPPPEIPRLPPP